MNKANTPLQEPPVVSHVEPCQSESVGARLQALRKKHGLSQRELARRADVTNSTLSMIEQGKVSPSVGSLEKILHAFPISLQEFFSASLEMSPCVIRAGEFIEMKRAETAIRILPLSMGSKRDGIYLAEQTYPPGARISSEWMVHNGFIGGIVVIGTVELHLEGVRYLLETGDGFNFSLHREHAFINTGDGTCKLVCASMSE